MQVHLVTSVYSFLKYVFSVVIETEVAEERECRYRKGTATERKRECVSVCVCVRQRERYIYITLLLTLISKTLNT